MADLYKYTKIEPIAGTSTMLKKVNNSFIITIYIYTEIKVLIDYAILVILISPVKLYVPVANDFTIFKRNTPAVVC